MTAKIISFGIQKGGSSKTTTSGVVSYLLSKDYKVTRETSILLYEKV